MHRGVRSMLDGRAVLLVVPAAALVVHQLRYALAYGSRANAELAAQGHSYLHSLVPWMVLAAGAALSSFLRRAVHAARTGDPGPLGRLSAPVLWLLTTALLVVVYAGQEGLEELFSAGHPTGAAGVVGHGGWWAVPATTALLLAGCSGRRHVEPPPRATDAVPVPRESSVIAVPIDADPAAITRAIEQAVPRTLWTIDRHLDRCVPPQRLKVFGKRLKVTPTIGCTIVGVVTRGPIRLHGAGHDIVADVPIHARISARDVGGVLKGETATGSAMAHARIRLTINPDWTPHGTVALHYDWTAPPGIDFLGQRITFTGRVRTTLVRAPEGRKSGAAQPGQGSAPTRFTQAETGNRR